MTRILSGNSYHYIRGGSDAMYFSHANLFENQGWENKFFSMQHPKNIPCETSNFFADRIDYDLEQGLAHKLVSAGRIIYSFDAQRRISDLLDFFPADVAHFHCIYHHLSPSVLVETHRRGIPTFLTAHELKLACPAYKMMNSAGVCERCKGGKLWNVAAHRCIKDSFAASSLVMVESSLHRVLGLYRNNINSVIAPSQFYLEKLVDWGWQKDKITYIPNFIDVDAHNDAGIYESDFILYFGRLAPEKGLSTLIRAAAQSKVRVKLVGTGPSEQELRELAEALAAPVEFLGFRSGAALWELVDACRAMVLPSEWYENAPMSVIEGYARGKPLIGAAIGGIPELIEDDKTGWLFRSADVGDLAAALSQAMSTPRKMLEDMAHACRDFVMSNFTPAHYYTRMAALYERYGVSLR